MIHTQKLIIITFLSSTVTSDLRWRISWKKEVGNSFLSALTTQHCGFTQAAPYTHTLSNTQLTVISRPLFLNDFIRDSDMVLPCSVGRNETSGVKMYPRGKNNGFLLVLPDRVGSYFKGLLCSYVSGCDFRRVSIPRASLRLTKSRPE